MYNKLKSTILFILKITISIVCLFYVWNKIDKNSLLEILKNAQYIYLIVAFIFFIFSKLVSALRLNFYFTQIEINLTSLNNIKLYWIGMYYNLFLPGGIGGDAFKIYLLNKQFNVGHKKIFTAVILDRISGVFALGILFIIMFMFSSYEIPTYVYILLCLSLPMAFIIANYIIKIWFSNFSKINTRTTIYAFIVQILQIISVVFILKGLSIHTHTIDYLLIFLLSSIVAVLPISIGGIGAREFVFMYAGNLLMLEPTSSVSISMVFFVITAVGSLWGLLYTFKQHKIIYTSK